MHIDWLTVRQPFDKLDIFSDSVVQKLDLDSGELEWSAYCAKQHKGSYNSGLRIRSDGQFLVVSGNPSRWNKPDNLFGVSSVDAAIAVFNTVLVELGLPEFFEDERTYLAPRQLQSGSGVVNDGLSITRVDLTQNYSTGGSRFSEQALHALRAFRHRNKPPADFGSMLSWGGKSRYAAFKYYLKGPEIRAHKKRKCDHGAYLDKLADFCDSEGVVRFEVSFKSQFLNKFGLNRLGAWTPETAQQIMDSYALHSRSAVSVGSYMDISQQLEEYGLTGSRAQKAQICALAYMSGHDLKAGMSKSAFYRVRSDLLLVGIDISAPMNVSALRFSVQNISLSETAVPEWYGRVDTA
jgi:II/X family phage/plasmid replication protein